MAETPPVLEYKCPCCDAGLVFSQDSQKMTCNSCDNSFSLEDVRQYNDAVPDMPEDTAGDAAPADWDDTERETLSVYTCPSCGGELLTEATTAATFCPFCENPAILPGRLSGGLRPDGVLPFRTTKADAKAAFLKRCQKKPLLPKFFTQEQRVEKITGIYVPYWLYDCGCNAEGKYRTTRVAHWSDSRYHYTRTDTFLLLRSGVGEFIGVPVDGSQKMDNALMESLEPFDYTQIQEFHPGFLSGFLADKYDVPAGDGHPRVQQRIQDTMDGLLRQSCTGYGVLTPIHQNVRLQHLRARYVLLPVWMLHTQYRGKTYVFAMNGQTGKLTGSLPISPKRSWAWFGGIAGAISALTLLLQLLL